jgi:hypothetical protein
MDAQLRCPKCQYAFEPNEAAAGSSLPCPQCGFQVPVPISTAKIAQAPEKLTGSAFGCFGYSLTVGGIGLFVLGTIVLSQFGRYPGSMIAALFLFVAAATFFGSGILWANGNRLPSYESRRIQHNATMLLLTLIAGVCAVFFACASCFVVR